MFNTPKILGISMAAQKNRRLLVVVACTILVAFAAVFAVLPSWVHELGSFSFQFAVLAGLLLFLVPRYWFTKLTKLTPLGRRPRSAPITRLGLTPGPRDPYDPDEREVAVRNAAFYKAYRVLIFYSILPIVALYQLSSHLNSPAVRRLADCVVLVTIVILWTLPQAIIVWTEPDVPEEARV